MTTESKYRKQSLSISHIIKQKCWLLAAVEGSISYLAISINTDVALSRNIYKKIKINHKGTKVATVMWECYKGKNTPQHWSFSVSSLCHTSYSILWSRFKSLEEFSSQFQLLGWFSQSWQYMVKIKQNKNLRSNTLKLSKCGSKTSLRTE